MKKILHLAYNAKGGVNTFIQQIVANTINEYDNTICIINNYDGGELDNDSRLNIVHFKKNKCFSLSVIIGIIREIKRNDVVHVHLFPMFYLVAFLIPFFRHKTFVLTEHASRNNRRKYSWIRYVEIFIYKRYSYVVGVSNSCSTNLKEWLLNKVSIVTINNGIERNDAYGQIIRINYGKEYGITAKYVIVMVARLTNEKEFETPFGAFTYLNDDYHLVILGDGYLKEHLEFLIKSKNIENRVSLLGFKNNVLNHIVGSSLSMLSSYGEGFSLSILESLAMHVPCIGSDVDGIRDVLPNSHRFKLEDDKALASLIENVVMRRIEPMDFDSLLEKFSLRKTIRGYKILYNSMI